MTFPAKRAPRLPRQACVQDALNEAGRAATEHCLRLFDSAGAPVEVAGRKLTTKGPTPKKYQTPYGEVNLPRHVYQDSGGGGTFCPLENDARIVNATTPRLAQMCARKYASMNSQLAREDLRQSYRREVSRCYLQDTAAAVADIVQSKGEHWMTFLSNHLEWSAQTICDLYKARWEIEVFFKQIKQTLKLSDFLGHSANAVRWQVWSALLVYVLLRFLSRASQWAHSFTRLFAIVRAGLWKKFDLMKLLRDRYGTAEGGFRNMTQPEQAYFPGY